MSEEPEVIIVGCAAVAAMAESQVPSERVQCSECGNDLWLAIDLRDDLMEQYPDAPIEARCAYTCMPDEAPARVEVTERQRQSLHERGMSDEEIQRGIEWLRQITGGVDS